MRINKISNIAQIGLMVNSNGLEQKKENGPRFKYLLLRMLLLGLKECGCAYACFLERRRKKEISLFETSKNKNLESTLSKYFSVYFKNSPCVNI